MSKFHIIKFLLLVLIVSSCSVYKASSNEGISVGDIKKCKTQSCFLSFGMDIINSHEEKNGEYIVTFRAKARKSGVNYIRAAGHGVLDVATFGLWEVAGTPLEGAISNNRGFITVKASFKSKSDEIASSIEIYDAYGHMVIEKK